MIDHLKKQIIDSRFKHKIIDKLSDYQLDSKDAYKIQEEINNILSNNGLGKIIGYKIGCTNKAIQKELNVVEPIYGALFKNKVIKNDSNLSIKNFIKVGVECEIYVSISKDIIDQDQFSKEKIENLINYCGLSLEIVEDRFVEIKKNTIEHIIIDGSLGNSIILGKKIRNKFSNYSKFIGRLFLNNKEIYSCSSDSILGDPLNALKWYFQKQLALKRTINKGEIISLGSITPLLWINKPCTIKAKIDELGECSINFTN